MNTLRKVFENVWETSAPLNLTGLRMNHRMTVVLLESGDVVVHSPIKYSVESANEIQEIGKPRWFIAPSRYHDMYWPEWFRAFPRSRFVGVAGMKEDHPELPFTDVLAEDENVWDGELLALPVRGMPKLNEWVILHPSSRTLVLADLIFNFDADAQSLAGKLFLRANGIYRKAGISRMFRMFIKDRAAVQESLQEIQRHSFDRIVIGHGANLGGNDVFGRAIADAGLQ